ncbi:MAG: ferrochelatase [Bryobacteraceae bacterium]|nr:ferrochelatase [Bryobacteraceae bacterium]
MSSYDAFLLVGFGGPEKPEDVMPFLENVTRGRNVPRERLLEVAEHYYHFGGKSPINDQNRALLEALRGELAMPLYWGNRNWHPFLADTLRQMKQDGVKRAVAFVTSAFSSYSGCRQYREDIAKAQAAVGEGAPEIDKIRVFYDHPAFLEVVAAEARDAMAGLSAPKLFFTAHSIPVSMSNGCRYVKQLEQACGAVAAAVGLTDWRLVYQSRSGPPSVPWLEPDIRDAIGEEHARGMKELVVVPIGFVSDHLEVLFDLDTEAKQLCEELGVTMHRAATAGTHPRFVGMIRELVEERMAGGGVRADLCGVDCCLPPARPPR